MASEDKPLEPGKIVEPSKYKAGKSQYTLIIDSTQAGVEEKYFSILRFLQNTQPFGLGYKQEEIEKIKDIYTAGEMSSYWGTAEQKRAAQIDKFQQIMGNIGNMIKSLFQLLRELRIMDERLEYYDRSNKGEDAAEVALKSVWVDMVEGGGKNPGSVTGLAMNVGFFTLPDLFYSVHPKNIDSVEREVDKLKDSFNRKVREVLARKLKQYMIWKEKTYEELKTGQRFKLKYMRQHYHVIKIYLNWLRPYLRNIRRLQMKGPLGDSDIVAAFDTSKIELEVIATKKEFDIEVSPGLKETHEFKHFIPCLRVRWNFVAIPEMVYQQDYQRGAIHRGRSTIIIDAFVADENKKELENYKKKIDDEDLELLAAVDDSILAMKDEIDRYLTKAGEEEKKAEEPHRQSLFEPITSVVSGFKDMFGLKNWKLSSRDRYAGEEEKQAKEIVSAHAYLCYKVFKKTHGMMAE